ncbi:4'-phosphopantetheinyl transferase family protein [Alicyclobacillus fodiniaquatilis]|uniref:4'-phosphopantetheinyl transferase family protein n=1 Tax=Alicyclobacillus fodiniaquatilis TaxID=1661150 RepID=A0ABW4JEM7_9BACL
MIIQLYWTKIPDAIDMDKLQTWLRILDDDEIGTYQKYRVSFKKVEFLIGRIMLKLYIANHTETPLHRIHFKKDVYGKLHFVDYNLKARKQAMYFSLAHSSKVVVCSFTTQCEIGVDVECVETEHFSIMPMVFTQDEISFVNTKQSPNEKNFNFYLIWTRKEAYLKAVGKGFHISPLSFSVPQEMGVVCRGPWEFNTFFRDNYIISTACQKNQFQETIYQMHKIDFHDLLDCKISNILSQ